MVCGHPGKAHNLGDRADSDSEQHLNGVRAAIAGTYAGSTTGGVCSTDEGQATRGHAATLTSYLLKLLLLHDRFAQGCGYQCWVGEREHIEGMESARTRSSGRLLQQLTLPS